MGSGHKVFHWDINLNAWKHRFVHIETRSGGVRTGKITAIDWFVFKASEAETTTTEASSAELRLPVSVELNGDVSDRINITQIAEIRLS